MCDQVVTVQHVDDIDEVHQLDPVHQVDHKDELWGDPAANFCCFFFEIITFCALVGAILIFSSKSSTFGPWRGPTYCFASKSVVFASKSFVFASKSVVFVSKSGWGHAGIIFNI